MSFSWNNNDLLIFSVLFSRKQAKIFFRKRVMYELRGLFIKKQSNRKSINARLTMCKLLIANEDTEDLPFAILELYTYVVSCFWTQVITKNMTLFYFCIYFRILVPLNQKKSDNIKLSRKSFLYKQEMINTCTAKLQ